MIGTIEYDYPTFHLSMDCFWAEIVSGDQVILVKPITDMKIVAKMKKDFLSPISVSEFLKSCSTAPYVISEEFAYKAALQIISDNKEYSEYIKVELA